ncbi:MAG: caspase family protein [Roseibium sp.]|uniref:caspase family protein n=1 Tax=Roseibium sp. TaxID=1936156 RepID=UPI003D9C1508
MRQIVCVLALVFLVVFSHPAMAKRVALVVGNGAYEYAPLLANPENDATAVATVLRRLDFEVIEGIDLTRLEFEAKIRQFARAIRGADIALFYFAGHGLQVAGKNYLAPIETRLLDEADLEFEAIGLQVVLRQMNREPRTNLVILDACRNNPLLRNLAATMGSRSASVGQGLAAVETGIGTLIAYSTQPGNVALDGAGENSPFTGALVRHIETPGEDIGVVMRRVRQDVIQETDGRQVPWDNSSLIGSVILKAPEPVAERAEPVQQAAIAPNSLHDELALYGAADKLNTPRSWALYFRSYPEGSLSKSAETLEEEALQSEVRYRVFGRYRTPLEGTEISGDMRRVALDMIRLPQDKVKAVQTALATRGNDVGTVDGQAGSRTLNALRVFQRYNGLPDTGYLGRATVSALGVLDESLDYVDVFATSGATARLIDEASTRLLETDPRLHKLIGAVPGREMIYGYFQGRLYAAIYMGSTFGRPDIEQLLDRFDGKLVEINSAEEHAFVVEMVRFDRKLWTRGTRGLFNDYGPTIGLETVDGRAQWQSGAKLTFTNWAGGQARRSGRQQFGMLVPAGRVQADAQVVERAAWALAETASHSIIVEID